MDPIVRLWLDDVRPAPDGWTWCKSTADAKALMQAGPVEEMSWMEETGRWPRMKPRVHSANPAGAARMQVVIDRAFAGAK